MHETDDMEEQEYISQLIAEEYLMNVALMADNENDVETEPPAPIESMPSDLEYDDNYIYKNLSESNAWGYVDAVLEIPAIELRQTVFSGTPTQIEHDLSYWLTVTGRSDYILGATHYCIYAHNPTNKTVRISYAQSDLKVDDYILLTSKGNVYFYSVSGLFPEWREQCTEKYVNNMTLDNKLLYIFTCGRDEWQNKNVVIEGYLVDQYSIADWNANKDDYIQKYKNSLSPIVEEAKPQEPMIMDLTTKNDKLNVSLKTSNYQTITDCTIGIFNMEGYLIDIAGNPFVYDGGVLELPKLDKGNYYIGVYENNTEYLNPQEYSITIDTKQHIQDIVMTTEKIDQNATNDALIVTVSMCITAVSVAICVGCLIYAMIKAIKKKRT